MPLSNVNPKHYQQQLDQKEQRITQQFAQFNPPKLQVYASPALHFRQRAEFKIWHDGTDSYYTMFKPEQPKTPIRIDEFPIGSKPLVDAMRRLMAAILADDELRRKLFQVEFLTTLSGEVLATLIYHRPLGEQWQIKATAIQDALGMKIIGRSKKQKLVLSDDFVTEVLTVAGKRYQFQQVEGSFTQPNATVNQHMLEWAKMHSEGLGGDLLELYCGNGNFTTVLAENYHRVLATEISKTSVKSANYNFSANKIENVSIARMSSEEFSAALDGERKFRRLETIDLNDYQFSTILVDPPRAGLDAHTEQMAARFDTIFYISCNPDTLYQNIKQLDRTHVIKQFAIFDQFPYTHHVECGVMLTKRNLS